ncbi:MAG: secretin N-terminal domain-containing protein, partial [Phycisphaerae bacterium]
SEAINQAYGPGARRQGGRGTTPSQFTVTAHDATKRLFVRADDELFSEIESLVKSLDQPKIVPFDFRIFRLAHADARQVHERMSKLLRDYVAMNPALRDQMDAYSIEVDEKANALIALGSPVVFGFLEQSLKQVDVETKEDSRIKIHSITHADPASVAKIITDWAQSRRPAGARGGGGASRNAVLAVAEAATRSVVVTASEANHRIIDELIRSLDVDSGRFEVKTITLQRASADAVARTLTEVFVKSGRQRSGQGQQPTVSALQGSRTILVKADPEEFGRIAAIVAELDRDDTAAAEEVRVVSLRYEDATAMQAAMQEYLRKPGGVRANELVGDVRLSVLTQSNALVISGTTAEVDRLEATIEKLDLAGEEGSVPQIIPIEHAHASDIAANLEKMFADAPRGGRGGRSGGTPPVIIADEMTKRLIVKAGPSDLTAIKELVRVLDAEGETAETFRLVQVGHGVNVTDLALTVEQSINDSAQRQYAGVPGRQPPTITAVPERRVNGIIFAGSPQLFDNAEKMVRALEEASPPGGRAVRMLRLGSVPAEDIQRLIQRLKGDDGRTGDRSRRGRTGRGRGNRAGRSRSSRQRSNTARRSGGSRRPRQTNRSRRRGG